MPPLVCPSPLLIDQSFPRSPDELQMVLDALGEIVEGITAETFALLLTDPLLTFVRDCGETMDWSKVTEFPKLQLIYAILSGLGLQQFGVKVIDLTRVMGHRPHPVPVGAEGCLSAELWADQVGRVFVLHQRSLNGTQSPFIGVACTQAFSGNGKGCYVNPDDGECPPLVGPNDITQLGSYETWDVRADYANRTITFLEAKTNVRLLGGRVNKPRGGSSHYEVTFKGARTWPLDRNFREIPEAYIAQLVEITKFELAVVKFVLSEGRMPAKISRI